MPVPTRAEVEQILASIPVGSRAKSNKTKAKKKARNKDRKDAVLAYINAAVERPIHRQMILDDLMSYQGWEREEDDDA